MLEISAWCSRFSDCKIIVAGDFNVDLDGSDIAARNVLTSADNNIMILSTVMSYFPMSAVPLMLTLH